MAEVRGRRCDRPDCDTFVEGTNSMPPGWVQVMPKVEGDKDPKAFELCSNYCVAYLFLDRYEADTGKRLVRQSKRGTYKKRDKET